MNILLFSKSDNNTDIIDYCKSVLPKFNDLLETSVIYFTGNMIHSLSFIHQYESNYLTENQNIIIVLNRSIISRLLNYKSHHIIVQETHFIGDQLLEIKTHYTVDSKNELC